MGCGPGRYRGSSRVGVWLGPGVCMAGSASRGFLRVMVRVSCIAAFSRRFRRFSSGISGNRFFVVCGRVMVGGVWFCMGFGSGSGAYSGVICVGGFGVRVKVWVVVSYMASVLLFWCSSPVSNRVVVGVSCTVAWLVWALFRCVWR